MADKAPDTMSDAAVGWMILGVVFIALGWLIWHNFEYQIKDGIRWIRYAEMKAVTLFVDEDYTITWRGIRIPYEETVKKVPKLPANCALVRNPEQPGVCLNDSTMHLLSAMALEPLRWFFIGFLGFLGIWAYQYGPKTHYRRKLTLDGLLGFQAITFPVISPFVRFNPANQPPRPPGTPVPAELPLFAEALGPEEWLAYNSIPVPDGHVDEQAAFAAFTKQLGPPWRGALRLEPYKQVLLAAFCLKASRKRTDADNMLSDLARCWTPEKGLRVSSKLLKSARAVLANKDLAAQVLSACNQHAFQNTALLRALLVAREEGGVLSPSQFVWLRGHDRHLWYPLNNLGRQAFHLEALGAMAHFKAEKITMRPIPRPKMEEAVQSITEYMASPRARPIPQLDYSKSSKKRAVKQPGKSGGVKQSATARSSSGGRK